MSSRCLVLFYLFIAAQSAIIQKRNIPVEVVYVKPNPGQYASRNLDEKVQLPHQELLRLKLTDDIINEGKEPIVEEEHIFDKNYGVKNLDAKVQLSPEELLQAVKHLPNVANDEELIKSELPETTAAPTEKPVPEYTMSFLKKAEEIVYAGICQIRKNIDKVSETVSAAKPSEEEWEKINKTFQNFFDDQYKNLDVKDGPDNQNNQNNQFIDSFISNFQSMTNNFMQTYFPQNNQQTGGTEDEQQGQGGQGQGANAFAGFVNAFASGFNQIVGNINNMQNSTANQEDTGTEQNQGNNFINNVINSVQQFFGQNQGSPSTDKPTQGDEGTASTTPQNGPAQIFQSIGNQISNFIRPTQKPSNSEDEGTSSTQSTNFIDNINQGLQNFNIFNRPSTAAPQGGSSGGSSSGSGSNPISSITNQFQQSVGGNPIENIQNAISGGSKPSSTTTEKSKGDISPEEDENTSTSVPESTSQQSKDQTETAEVTEKLNE